MAENVPNPGKETDIQTQKGQRVASKRSPPRHIIIKMPKERILKTAREKQLVTYEESPISL